MWAKAKEKRDANLLKCLSKKPRIMNLINKLNKQAPSKRAVWALLSPRRKPKIKTISPEFFITAVNDKSLNITVTTTEKDEIENGIIIPSNTNVPETINESDAVLEISDVNVFSRYVTSSVNNRNWSVSLKNLDKLASDSATIIGTYPWNIASGGLYPNVLSCDGNLTAVVLLENTFNGKNWQTQKSPVSYPIPFAVQTRYALTFDGVGVYVGISNNRTGADATNTSFSGISAFANGVFINLKDGNVLGNFGTWPAAADTITGVVPSNSIPDFIACTASTDCRLFIMENPRGIFYLGRTKANLKRYDFSNLTGFKDSTNRYMTLIVEDSNITGDGQISQFIIDA